MKFDIKPLIKTIQQTIHKHAPEIMTGIGVAGMVSTTIFAVKATPKALELIEEKKLDEEKEELTKLEVVQATWKCYIPAAVTGTMSILCIVGGSTLNAKRNAALATAYALSETTFKEYKDKVVETIGEKKEEEVRSAIAEDHIQAVPATSNGIIETGHGKTLWFDPKCGRYFRCDIEFVRKALNAISRSVLLNGSASLNDIYDYIGLDESEYGSMCGWNVQHGLPEEAFLSKVAVIDDIEEPCMVLAFRVDPSYNYDAWM